jgi:hypothetical protein
MEAECGPLRHEHDAAAGVLSELHASLRIVSGELQGAIAHVTAQERLLASMNETMTSGRVTGDAFVQAVDARAALQRAVDEAQKKARALEAKREAAARQVQMQENVVGRLRLRLEAKEQTGAEIEGQLTRVRSESSAAIGAIE